jgi:predicted 2-oxoglutarate/Fe(II)-dependent dioxygenase YbiX
MLSIEQFIDLGLFVKEDFLNSELLDRVSTEISSNVGKPSPVLTNGRDALTSQLCKTLRQTEEIQVSSKTKSLIEERLIAIRPQVANYFSLELNSEEGLLFYRYRKEGFFIAHRDRSDRLDAPDYLKQRRVSIVIFLNEMSDEPLPKCYGGGHLVFYGMFEDPIWQSYGFPFPSKPGMLVAFRSDILHEVKSVTHGERYTAVNWFI